MTARCPFVAAAAAGNIEEARRLSTADADRFAVLHRILVELGGSARAE